MVFLQDKNANYETIIHEINGVESNEEITDRQKNDNIIAGRFNTLYIYRVRADLILALLFRAYFDIVRLEIFDQVPKIVSMHMIQATKVLT